jgi:hypothetical protein
MIFKRKPQAAFEISSNQFVSLKLLKMMIRVTSRYIEGEASALHL